METMIIGIAGGTGSGKTTLTLRLKEHFGEDVSILYHDNYYKQHDDMPYEERCRLNYDHPDAFDTELLIADLQALRRGEAVHSPTYDYTVHNRAAETVEVRPARVILVEGILIFVDPALRELMDKKLYQAPVNQYFRPGEYEAVINRSLQTYHPEYWQARAKDLKEKGQPSIQRKKKERER